jgi:hypothetical protein
MIARDLTTMLPGRVHFGSTWTRKGCVAQMDLVRRCSKSSPSLPGTKLPGSTERNPCRQWEKLGVVVGTRGVETRPWSRELCSVRLPEACVRCGAGDEAQLDCCSPALSGVGAWRRMATTRGCLSNTPPNGCFSFYPSPIFGPLVPLLLTGLS